MVTRKRRTKAQMRTYRSRQASSRKYRLRTVHRMTMEQYEAILALQGGVCALCGMKGATAWLAVDHDHKIAREMCSHSENESCPSCWRGLVHRGCNAILGRLRDNIDTLRRYINYLEDPPARRVPPGI